MMKFRLSYILSIILTIGITYSAYAFVVFFDNYTVSSDINIESYPSGSPNYTLVLGSSGNVIVSAANDRVETAVGGTFRVRCSNAACNIANAKVTITGDTTIVGNRVQASPAVRVSASDDSYVCRINAVTLNVEILRYDAGAPTVLTSVVRGLLAGTHTVNLTATGTGASVTLDCQVDATAVVSISDASANRKLSGFAGFQLFADVPGTPAWLDNFTVDNLLSLPVSRMLLGVGL